MDIGDPSVPGTDIKDGFGETPAFAWLQEHATEYGFIFRYRKETEAITGIAYEPWHYRYVGANHAEKIVELNITLEEYIDGYA
jgi:D-alanyl-D-alanine carboxypeptidase